MRRTSRRAVLAAVLGAGAGGAAVGGGDLLDSFAPLSGATWERTRGTVPETVGSPHGDARVTYDDYHVPHVEADDERAAYFAVGYVHAADRLFEMDLLRRLMDGRLSAALGERTVESDVFHVKMDFRAAAEASLAALSGTDTERMLAAYRDGVNAYRETGPDPLEFGLAGYDAGPWTTTDSLLVGKQIAWGLTGSFRALRRAHLRERLSASRYRDLYPDRFDHGTPILRDETGGEVSGVGDGPVDASVDTPRGATAPTFVDHLGRFEPSKRLGSNHWAVAGAHTDTGRPMLAYDPHLTLLAPPLWYEQHVVVGDREVRGAAFPGTPFVVVGETDRAAWGFTNTGADVMDLYTYETDIDAGEYRAPDGWRSFETTERTVAVAGGEDRTVQVRKTVHGPFLDREVAGERRHVGVAWTGTSGTRETRAIHECSRAAGLADYRDALRLFDCPTQNALYVDDDRVLYKVTGQIPVRRVGGEVVRGDRVFDGSAGEATWEGFEPFGQSTWTGFVPFEDKPGAVDPDYLGTANQRPTDDPRYPVGQEYDDGFRGVRIYERLDERVASGDPVDRAFMTDLQRDTLDVRARMLVPAVLDARDRMPAVAADHLDALADWDYRMDRDSEAALFFDQFLDAFERHVWETTFEDLGESFWPAQWVLLTLPPDHPVFDGDRAGALAVAAERAAERIESEGWETYGDENRTTLDHQFGGQVAALNYPRYPTDGSGETVFNVHDGAAAGSSWRQVSSVGGTSLSVLPGGQSGSVFSDHYDDQLRMWADGEYKSMDLTVPDDGDRIAFAGEEK